MNYENLFLFLLMAYNCLGSIHIPMVFDGSGQHGFTCRVISYAHKL